MSRRDQPRCIIQCPRLDIPVWITRTARNVIEPRPAVRAKPAFHCLRRADLASKHFRVALRDAEMLLRNHRTHCKRGPGLLLAFSAMAGIYRYRWPGDFIADRAALTSSR